MSWKKNWEKKIIVGKVQMEKKFEMRSVKNYYLKYKKYLKLYHRMNFYSKHWNWMNQKFPKYVLYLVIQYFQSTFLSEVPIFHCVLPTLQKHISHLVYENWAWLKIWIQVCPHPPRRHHRVQLVQRQIIIILPKRPQHHFCCLENGLMINKIPSRKKTKSMTRKTLILIKSLLMCQN